MARHGRNTSASERKNPARPILFGIPVCGHKFSHRRNGSHRTAPHDSDFSDKRWPLTQVEGYLWKRPVQKVPEAASEKSQSVIQDMNHKRISRSEEHTSEL